MRFLANDSWVRPYLKQYKWSLLLALVLGVLTFLAASALMFTSGYLIAKSASHPFNILAVYIPIVLVRCFGIARPALRYIERLVSHNWVLKMTSHLRLKLYQVLEQDAVFLSQKYQTGKLLGLLSEDIAHIQNLYLRTIFPLTIAYLLSLVLVVAIGCFSITYGILVAVILVCLVGVVPLYSVLVNGARLAKIRDHRQGLYTELTDNVLGIADWMVSGKSQDYVRHHEALEAAYRELDVSEKAFSRRRDFGMQVLFALLVLIVIVFATTQFTTSINYIVAFALAVFPLNDMLMPLPAAMTSVKAHENSLQRLNSLPKISEVAIKSEALQAPFELSVDHVSFGYEEVDLLRNITLQIKQGEKLAILGPSGAGKTTLLQLLRGDLLPIQGQVSLSGVPMSQLGDQVADYISVVQQRPYLFNTSVGNNLRIGNERASDEQLYEVIEQVGLSAIITDLNQPVAEAGLNLSGGQGHRLALARVLLANTPIVLLDEPTVGLDPVTEKDLLETIFATLSDKTVIWVTHHLAGVKHADRVIFLENGGIALEGHHEDLLKKSDRYARIYAIDTQGR